MPLTSHENMTSSWITLALFKHLKFFCVFSSVTQSCLTLCDPMGCITPGFPVPHQLPELAQTHVHQVSDAIQPSHPLSPAFSCLQSFLASGFFFSMSQFFASGGQSTRASASALVLPMNIQDWLPLQLTGLRVPWTARWSNQSGYLLMLNYSVIC